MVLVKGVIGHVSGNATTRELAEHLSSGSLMVRDFSISVFVERCVRADSIILECDLRAVPWLLWPARWRVARHCQLSTYLGA